jgi:hypothetical protein
MGRIHLLTTTTRQYIFCNDLCVLLNAGRGEGYVLMVR